MHKFSSVLGEFVGPIIFMGLCGYGITHLTSWKVLPLIICLILGFVVGVFNVWRVMKRIGSSK